MFTQQGIDAVGLELVKSLAIIIPVFLTVYFNSKKTNRINKEDSEYLSTKMEDGFEKNNKDHTKIFEYIQSQDTDKGTLNHIRYAISDACRYISSINVKKILDIFATETVRYVQEVLSVDSDKITFDIIDVKYSNLRDEMKVQFLFYIKDINIVNKYYEVLEPLRLSYLLEMKDIYADKVNNWRNRFSIETVKYVQKIANTTVKFLQQHPVE